MKFSLTDCIDLLSIRLKCSSFNIKNDPLLTRCAPLINVLVKEKISLAQKKRRCSFGE